MDAYSPKPLHMIYPVILFALGTWCFRSDDWFVLFLGGMLWVLGWVLIGWIIYAGIADHRSRYWDSVAGAVNAVNKSDVEKLASIGFTQKDIESHVSVEMTDQRDGMYNKRYFELPVSSAKLVPLAQGVLNGQPFTRRRWEGLLSDSEFRSLHGVMRDRGYIKPISEKDNRQGFTLTDEGRELFQSVLG